MNEPVNSLRNTHCPICQERLEVGQAILRSIDLGEMHWRCVEHLVAAKELCRQISEEA